MNNNLLQIKDNFCSFNCPYKGMEESIDIDISKLSEEAYRDIDSISIDTYDDDLEEEIKSDLQDDLQDVFDKIYDKFGTMFDRNNRCINLCPLNAFLRILEDEKIL